ncbi:hypothetical protein LCGC14_2378400 [marine sediment metagenome]|uniref:Uncharacterized protein n=1 Tax=marine sediment metagenome TaxID=412755 RepID=A0A0F9C1N0_9ZZZZ
MKSCTVKNLRNQEKELKDLNIPEIKAAAILLYRLVELFFHDDLDTLCSWDFYEIAIDLDIIEIRKIDPATDEHGRDHILSLTSKGKSIVNFGRLLLELNDIHTHECDHHKPIRLHGDMMDALLSPKI